MMIKQAWVWGRAVEKCLNLLEPPVGFEPTTC
jgi:hypothetical protein